MNEAITKAIEGGWNPKGLQPKRPVNSAYIKALMLTHGKSILLDPLFWQALGKAEGWAKDQRAYPCTDCGTVGVMDYNHMMSCKIRDRKLCWSVYWHRFIDHISEGKDIDSFFTNLFNK